MKKITIAVAIMSCTIFSGATVAEDKKLFTPEDIQVNYTENPYVLFQLAHDEMSSGTPNFQRVVELFHRSYELGIKEAGYNLGVMYYNGIGVKRDKSKALGYWSRTADESLSTQIKMANEYRMSGDYENAFRWYYMAAQGGDIKSKIIVGKMLFFGKGIAMDTELGIGILEEVASDESDSEVYYELGLIHDGIENYPLNYQKAREYYEKSAELGSINAQVAVGDMYEYGKGVKQNYEKAYHWYSKAATTGNVVANSRVADLYLYGFGVADDVDKAIEHYERAANYGDPHSLYQLASIYMKDKHGVRHDYKRAVEYYHGAVDNGHKESMRELGMIYRVGIDGVLNKDPQKYRELIARYSEEDVKKAETIKKVEIFRTNIVDQVDEEFVEFDGDFRKYLK